MIGGKVQGLKFVMVALVLMKIVAAVYLFSGVLHVPRILWETAQALAQENAPGATPASEETTSAEEKQKAEEEKAAKENLRITLDGLEKKRIALQKSEAELASQKAELERLKQEIDEKVDALAKIQAKVEATLAKMQEIETQEQRKKREAHERRVKQLLKVYSGMKPRDVGAIMDKLDFNTAMEVFTRMKSGEASKILTYMNQARAVRISEVLAAKKNGK